MTPRHRHPGFTLVELLTALVITVLVVGATAAALRTTTAARGRVDRQLRVQAEARAAINAITAAMHNAYLPADAGAQGFEGFDDAFDGLPFDRIRFFTTSYKPVRSGQPESDVRMTEFFLLASEDQTKPAQLMQRIDPTRNEQPDEGGVLRRIALGVAAMDIHYHNGAEWSDEWTPAMGWPTAVRIDLLLTDAEHPGDLWPVSRLVSFPQRPAPQQQEGQPQETPS